MRVTRASVDGLFGYLNHEVKFSLDSPVTIIAGPNGVGKTHLLRLINALINLELPTLEDTYFASLELTFSDESVLRASRLSTGQVELQGKLPSSRTFKKLILDKSEQTEDNDLPPWVVRTVDGGFYDTRQEHNVTDQFLRARYGVRPSNSRRAIQGTWAEPFYKDPRSILIDTKRLDTPANHRSETMGRPKSESAPSRIHLYTRQLTALLNDARRRSLNAALESDQSFASRALEKARTTINERDLKERYQRIADQQAELHANGLSVKPVDVKFPEGKATPTERRILNIFLDDWEKKLRPLLPIHEKLKLLRAIVDTKFMGKELVLSSKGALSFRTLSTRNTLTVDSLSSGEQHLLAVFTMLLFSTPANALVLIDEPEISMHAAWKHEFVADISNVARISNLQIVLATHSSALINGQWDLVREIEVPAPTPSDGNAETHDFEDLEEE